MMTIRRVTGLVLAVVLVGCGGGSDSGAAADSGSAPAVGGELTAQQLERGIGPVTELELGPMDAALVSTGKSVFDLKCSACHKMAERYVGPALGEVLERRRPEYVMNMILNPAEMVEKHPAARELLAQFMTPMPDQNLTPEDARAVLEYLRSVQEESSGEGTGGQ